MGLDFGRITGFFRARGRLAFRILPPTLMTPSLYRTGSNMRRELAILNRASFSLSDLRLPYFSWMSWRLLISDGNSSLCTCFMISISAFFKSVTLTCELVELTVTLIDNVYTNTANRLISGVIPIHISLTIYQFFGRSKHQLNSKMGIFTSKTTASLTLNRIFRISVQLTGMLSLVKIIIGMRQQPELFVHLNHL